MRIGNNKGIECLTQGHTTYNDTKDMLQEVARPYYSKLYSNKAPQGKDTDEVSKEDRVASTTIKHKNKLPIHYTKKLDADIS